MIVDVERLYIKLHKLFSQELLNLNIGYSQDISNLKPIMDLINAIDYIENNNPSNDEIVKIINYYGE